jgi:hypothetical protein
MQQFTNYKSFLKKYTGVVYAIDCQTQPSRNYAHQKEALLHKSIQILPVCEQNDFVVVHQEVNADYTKMLSNLGLSSKRIINYDNDNHHKTLPQLINEFPQKILQQEELQRGKYLYMPYYASKLGAKCARKLNMDFFGCDEAIIEEFYDKIKFKHFCNDIGIKTIPGEEFYFKHNETKDLKGFLEICTNLLNRYLKIVIRGNIGSAGVNTHLVSNKNEVENIYKILQKNGISAVLIEPFCQVLCSPSSRWIIDLDNQLTLQSITLQIFDGFSCKNTFYSEEIINRFSKKIKTISHKLISHMQTLGYRGHVGFDYIVTKSDIFPVECNPRMTLATFQSFLVKKIEVILGQKIPVWKTVNYKINPTTVKSLLHRVDCMIFTGNNINSIFLYECALLSDTGECCFLIMAEDMQAMHSLEKQLAKLLKK